MNKFLKRTIIMITITVLVVISYFFVRNSIILYVKGDLSIKNLFNITNISKPSTKIKIKLNLSSLDYKNNRGLSEAEFNNLLTVEPYKYGDGASVSEIINCSPEFIKFVYPSIYKKYNKIKFSSEWPPDVDGYQMWSILGADDEDIIASPYSDGTNYNDSFSLSFNYSECKFKFSGSRVFVKQSASELISKEILKNHPNKVLVKKFNSDGITCELSEVSERTKNLDNYEITKYKKNYLNIDEIKVKYPLFNSSPELIVGTCHTAMNYPSYFLFDVVIDPSTGRAFVSKDYEENYIVPM